jgi:hypothetical protein
MNKKDEQIERKIIELEASVASQTERGVADLRRPSSDLVAGTSSAGGSNVKTDLYYFAGLGLILTSVLLFFNHIHVGTGFLALLGMGGGGFGLLLIPLLIGIGWVFYDYKNKIGWAILAAACGLVFFSCLSSLLMTFPSISLLGLIMMLVPLALGSALLLKSVGGPAALKDKIRDENLLK